MDGRSGPADRSGWQGLPEWQGDVGRRWAAASATADEQFGWQSDAAYRVLGDLTGRRVLDVGCGSGGTTVELAARVGPTGGVTGIDPSADVLAVARARSATVSWVHDDAERHRFADGAFDVVFSRLGVMFFEHPDIAFANLRRATVPDGRLVFTCWPTRERVPMLMLPFRALVGLVELPPPAPPGSPNPFSLGDADATAAMLAGAGWRDVQVDEVRCPLELPADAEEAAERWLTTIPVTLSVQHPDPATRARLRSALAAAVPADRRIEQVALLVTARA